MSNLAFVMLGDIRNILHGRAGAKALELDARAAVPAIPLRNLWWAAIVLLAVSAGAASWTIWQLRTDAINAAIAESGNMATVLASQLSRSLQAIDTVLLEVKHLVEDRGVATPRALQDGFGNRGFQELLTSYRGRLPQVFNLAVADKDGDIIASSAGWPSPVRSVADRDFFRDAKERRDSELTASIPTVSRISGKETIFFARRIEDFAGNFAGIVFASVNIKYFEDIYGAIQSVNSLLFTLVRSDGTIVFRYPEGGDWAGRQLSNKQAWLTALANGDAGFRVHGLTDGNVRFVSIRKVPEYPLVVDISVTESTSLAAWRQRAAAIGVGSAVLLLLSIYLLTAVKQQVRSLSDSQSSLAQTTQQLDATLNNLAQGVSMYDAQRRLIVSNTQFAKLYGLTADQVRPGTPLDAVLAARTAVGSIPGDMASYAAASERQLAQAGLSHAIHKFRDGRIVSVTFQTLENGGWVSIHQDITEQQRVAQQLERMANHDALTGLANRALFMEKAGDAIARMRRMGQSFAVLMLDLDRFKTVNDSLGHPAGDALLKEVGRRLRQTVRAVDCVARFGGDEFAVLQAPDVDQRRGAIGLSQRLLKAVTEPYDLDGRKLVIETSIGIALAPSDGEDADVLIKNADLALYRAKAEGRNRFCFFEAAMSAEARNRHQLEEDMRRALLNREFELHYQTIVDLQSNECRGAEALVRWRHPGRGLIGPDQFIPIAEESGLIVPLGEWIVREACAEAAKWPPQVRVAVNLSPAQFKQGNLAGVVSSALRDARLAAQRLELEITETVLLEKNAANLAVLRDIKALGVSIVLDDFGIGYSSMTYLQMFPFDRIKIDRSFIRKMKDHLASAAIVCAIIGLGRALDIATTAEGVETLEQLTFVRAAGCSYAQGFLLGRPLPTAELSFEMPSALRLALQAA